MICKSDIDSSYTYKDKIIASFPNIMNGAFNVDDLISDEKVSNIIQNTNINNNSIYIPQDDYRYCIAINNLIVLYIYIYIYLYDHILLINNNKQFSIKKENIDALFNEVYSDIPRFHPQCIYIYINIYIYIYIYIAIEPFYIYIYI